jgi:hypothetical protein
VQGIDALGLAPWQGEGNVLRVALQAEADFASDCRGAEDLARKGRHTRSPHHSTTVRFHRMTATGTCCRNDQCSLLGSMIGSGTQRQSLGSLEVKLHPALGDRAVPRSTGAIWPSVGGSVRMSETSCAKIRRYRASKSLVSQQVPRGYLR